MQKTHQPKTEKRKKK